MTKLFLNKRASKILDKLTEGLTELGQARKIDTRKEGSAIMGVNVDFNNTYGDKPVFAISHTYIQNGDVMFDPEIQFMKVHNTHEHFWMPISFRQDGILMQEGFYLVLDKDDPDKITGYYNSQIVDAAKFANTWMINISEQQKEFFNPKKEDNQHGMEL